MSRSRKTPTPAAAIGRGPAEPPVTRRQALGFLGAAALSAGGLTLGVPSAFALRSKPRRPNFVFILTDDHRYDMLGAAGHPFLKTPHMDRLCHEGVRFENAFATTALCSPSRASFLTGQYASVHGVTNNFSRWDETRNVTFLRHLKRAGYDTAFVGKWHMPGGGLPRLPEADLFVSFTRKDGQGDYFNCPLYVNGRLTPNRTPYITEELTEYALDFVRQERRNPFCLYLSHKAVHHDWKPPRHLRGRHRHADLSFLAPESDRYNTLSGMNWLEGTLGNMHDVYRRYCECLESVDEQLGRLLAALEAKGLLDDTVVVYAGDNGYLWGEHRLYAKHYPYEESMRIPFLVRAPGVVSGAGRRVSRMVLNIDLATTFLDLAGLPVPGAMQGESFVPLLRSPAAPGRPAFVYELFRDFPFGGRVPPHQAIRTESHKLIEWEMCRPPELYDLRLDPREMNNLCGTPAGDRLAADLSRELETLRKRFHIRRGAGRCASA